jgi:exosortase
VGLKRFDAGGDAAPPGEDIDVDTTLHPNPSSAPGTPGGGTPLEAVLRSQYPFMLLALASVAAAYWSIVHGMVLDWMHDENSSHGFIVPAVSAYLIWQRRERLLATPARPSAAGLLIVALGAGMLIMGWLATEYFTMRFSLLVVLAGCVAYWAGWEVLRVLAGPMAYLVLMIPIPAVLYDALAFPLKLFVTKVSVAVLKALGIMVVREGNIMAFPNITLEVVNACSGLRSLTSLLAVGLAYVMLFVRSMKEKLAIVALIFPIALAANMVRVIGTGILAQYFGAAAAEGFFHEFAGLVIFLTSMALLLASHRILSRWLR